jgi:hypothetical protein
VAVFAFAPDEAVIGAVAGTGDALAAGFATADVVEDEEGAAGGEGAGESGLDSVGGIGPLSGRTDLTP